MRIESKARDYVQKGIPESVQMVNFLLSIAKPLTSRELAVSMGIDRSKTGRRLPVLQKNGFIRRHRKRICRISGRKAIAWSAY